MLLEEEARGTVILCACDPVRIVGEIHHSVLDSLKGRSLMVVASEQCILFLVSAFTPLRELECISVMSVFEEMLDMLFEPHMDDEGSVI